VELNVRYGRKNQMRRGCGRLSQIARDSLMGLMG
jgi:hypothetical protein